MDVFLANEQDVVVDEATLMALAGHALGAEEIDDDSELSVLLVGKDHMRLLNERFAGNDYPTDVLAFPMMEDEEEPGTLVGDVVICPEIAREHAAELNHPLDDELRVLVVHGTLHLLGYDHQTVDERAVMEQRLRQVLETFRT